MLETVPRNRYVILILKTDTQQTFPNHLLVIIAKYLQANPIRTSDGKIILPTFLSRTFMRNWDCVLPPLDTREVVSLEGPMLAIDFIARGSTRRSRWRDAQVLHPRYLQKDFRKTTILISHGLVGSPSSSISITILFTAIIIFLMCFETDCICCASCRSFLAFL